MFRSVLAVIAGYVTTTIVVMVGILLATVAFVPGGLRAAMSPVTELPPAYLTANLIVSFAAALVGGFVTARIATRSRRAHVLAFAGLLFVMSLLSTIAGRQPGQPDWYPWVVALVGIAGAAVAWFLTKDDARLRSARL
jgi:peptidoglycan/LPS O-acetylase OafA/YrhL